MENAIIGRCVYKDKTVSIPLYSHTSLLEVCSEICSRFNELKIGQFEITYFVADHPPCLLQTDLDVRVLHLNMVKERKNAITINVCEIVEDEPDHMDISVGDDGNEENEFLGKFAAVSSHTFLSNLWGTYINQVGQKFKDVEDFRERLSKYAIEKSFKVVYLKNEPDRVTAQCSKRLSEDCNWRVHATICRANGFFYIRRLNNEHSCSGRIRGLKNPMMSSKVVASILKEQIQSKPSMKAIEVVKDFKRYYGLDVSYYHAWYGLELARKMVHGDDALSYRQLAWYVGALEKSNPGSRCVLECDQDTSRFRRIFISYRACIEGFKFCRPMLFLDGTFIKNKYKGHLLAATGKNGNQGIFPLAFAIVDSENEENWKWFLQNLSELITPQGRIVTFISDRHTGLLEAVPFVFPNSPHAFCFHHLKQNILGKYPSSLGKTYREWIVHLFGKCAYAPTQDVFEMHINTLKADGGSVMRDFLDSLPRENWANAYFLGQRYGEMCSNVAESFNAWILDERSLPIYQLVEGIRIKIMQMNASRRRIADEWNTYLCPRMEESLEELLESGRHWDVIRSSGTLFEVHGNDAVMVDLQNRTCSCRMWQIKGFPCAHALVAIRTDNGNYFDYIEDYFTVHHFKRCYDEAIVPIPDIDKDAQEANEGDVVVNPPLTKNPPGRPKKKRVWSVGERKRPMRCGRCGQLGSHNRKTCRVPI